MDSADVLIALHARRSSGAVAWWTVRHPERPVIVAMTGTDLYADLPHDVSARASIEAADALITLQRAAVERLGSIEARWGAKATTIHQSVAGPHLPRELNSDVMKIVVLAHLRPVKDPLLAARAARRLPAESRVMVHHAGGPIDPDLTKQAIMEDETNARIVKLRIFGGMGHGEIAALMGVNEKSIRRRWNQAKVWLYRALREQS